MEARVQIGGRIEHRRRAHHQIGRDRRGRDAQALGTLAGANADAALDFEHHLKAADVGDGLAFLDLRHRRRRRHRHRALGL
jgi:hypothetical protein